MTTKDCEKTEEENGKETYFSKYKWEIYDKMTLNMI